MNLEFRAGHKYLFAIQWFHTVGDRRYVISECTPLPSTAIEIEYQQSNEHFK